MCDVDRPCKVGICNLDNNQCEDEKIIQEHKSDSIFTQIQGKKFIGSKPVIHTIISNLFETEYNVKCSLGQDYINMDLDFGNEDSSYRGQLLSQIENIYINNDIPVQLISFIDMNTGYVLCSIRQDLVSLWDAIRETDRYIGFVAIEHTDENKLVETKVSINSEQLQQRFYPLDLWTNKFITEEEVTTIKNSDKYIFIIYPTQYRWYDSSFGIGVHHNWGEESRRSENNYGDVLYGVIPVGVSREVLGDRPQVEHIMSEEEKKIAEDARERMRVMREEQGQRQQIRNYLRVLTQVRPALNSIIRFGVNWGVNMNRDIEITDFIEWLNEINPDFYQQINRRLVENVFDTYVQDLRTGAIEAEAPLDIEWNELNIEEKREIVERQLVLLDISDEDAESIVYSSEEEEEKSAEQAMSVPDEEWVFTSRDEQMELIFDFLNEARGLFLRGRGLELIEIDDNPQEIINQGREYMEFIRINYPVIYRRIEQYRTYDDEFQLLATFIMPMILLYRRAGLLLPELERIQNIYWHLFDIPRPLREAIGHVITEYINIIDF